MIPTSVCIPRPSPPQYCQTQVFPVQRPGQVKQLPAETGPRFLPPALDKSMSTILTQRWTNGPAHRLLQLAATAHCPCGAEDILAFIFVHLCQNALPCCSPAPEMPHTLENSLSLSYCICRPQDRMAVAINIVNMSVPDSSEIRKNGFCNMQVRIWNNLISRSQRFNIVVQKSANTRF